MSFICPVVSDANYPLDNRDVFVDDIITPVSGFFTERLGVDWKINIIVTTSLPWLIIPEDGVGGKTYASDFVILAIDQTNTTISRASEMLAHELTHAVRWGKNPEWSRNLFCELVNESLAVHVEAEFAKTQKDKDKTFFLETVLGRSDDENRKMFEKLKPEFELEKYNYDEVFFGGGKLPRWAGYSVGYYIVKWYLKKTGKSVFEVIGEPYANFKKCVGNFIIQ